MVRSDQDGSKVLGWTYKGPKRLKTSDSKFCGGSIILVLGPLSLKDRGRPVYRSARIRAGSYKGQPVYLNTGRPVYRSAYIHMTMVNS